MRAVILGLLVGFSGLGELLGIETPVPKATEGVSTTPNILKLGLPSETTTAGAVTVKTGDPNVSAFPGISAGQYGGYGGAYQAYRNPSINYYNAATASPVAAVGGQYGGYGGYGAAPLMGMRGLDNIGSYSSPYTSMNQASSMNQPSSVNQSPMDYYNSPYSSWTAIKGMGYDPRQFDYTKYQSSMNQFSKPGIADHNNIKIAGRLATRARFFNTIKDATADSDHDADLTPTTSTTKTVKHHHSKHDFQATTTTAPCEKAQQETTPALISVPPSPLPVKPAKPKKSSFGSFLSYFGK